MKFNFYRDTALNLAAFRQKPRLAKLLLEYRANPNIRNKAGKTTLHRAVISYTDEDAPHLVNLLNVRLFNVGKKKNFLEISLALGAC